MPYSTVLAGYPRERKDVFPWGMISMSPIGVYFRALDFAVPFGHSDVQTTMIYNHVLNRPGLVVRSPEDG
jgi:hypothetical protein